MNSKLNDAILTAKDAPDNDGEFLDAQGITTDDFAVLIATLRPFVRDRVILLVAEALAEEDKRVEPEMLYDIGLIATGFRVGITYAGLA
jgi:hypothetical protein